MIRCQPIWQVHMPSSLRNARRSVRRSSGLRRRRAKRSIVRCRSRSLSSRSGSLSTIGLANPRARCPARSTRAQAEAAVQIATGQGARRLPWHRLSAAGQHAGRCPSICRGSASSTPAPFLARPCCGGTTLRKIGEDVPETRKLIPRQWKVIQHVREKFSCRACEAISQPPAPSHPIARTRPPKTPRPYPVLQERP